MLTIGKLAGLAGTTPNTLRYYEREGLIPPPSKAENGYRLYPQDASRRVNFIRQAQQCGFTLSEIRELLTLPQQNVGLLLRCSQAGHREEAGDRSEDPPREGHVRGTRRPDQRLR